MSSYLGVPPQSGFITTAKQRVTSSTNNYVDLDHSISSLADVIVWVNFVKQDSTNLSLTTSTRITLGANLVASDICEIAFLGKAVATQTPDTGTVTLDMLSASGTKSSSTFLAGDNTFKTVSGTTINNNADNRVITGSGTANTLEGEANLTFDGTDLDVGASAKISSNGAIANFSNHNGSATETTLASSDGNEKVRCFNDGKVTIESGGVEVARFNHNGGDDNFFVHCTSTPSGGTKGFAVLGQIIISSSSSTSEQDVMRIEKPSGRVGSIVANNSSTSFNTSSDYRLKENQVAISDGITRLKTLKPYKFNFIVDKDEDDNVTKIVDGFFAHEVSGAVPEAVTGEKDAVDEDGKIKPQSIDQSKLVPLLTSALQEAITKIETLEARVQTLENA